MDHFAIGLDNERAEIYHQTMNIKRFIKKPVYETRVVVKSTKIYDKEVNPFEDLLKKKLSVPITLFNL